MLKEGEDIQRGMENLAMMLLQKEDTDLLTEKQRYLIKYLFGDYATSNLKN